MRRQFQNALLAANRVRDSGAVPCSGARRRSAVILAAAISREACQQGLEAVWERAEHVGSKPR
eukprot:m.69208 g.69208  ORF g.69208 m.69208 type:complete len:63 (-) comp7796_c1_seq1:56-244(-)